MKLDTRSPPIRVDIDGFDKGTLAVRDAALLPDGRTVVALGEGGVRDSVVEGTTGIFFDRPAVESLARALDAVESQQWDRAAIRAHAATFSRSHFLRQLEAELAETVRA